MLLQLLTGGEQHQWPHFPALLLGSRTSFCSVFVLCLAQRTPSPLLLSSAVHKLRFQADDTLCWFSLFFLLPQSLPLSPAPWQSCTASLPHFFAWVFYTHLPTLQMLAPLNHKVSNSRICANSQYSQATVLIRIFKAYHNFYSCYYY